MYFLIFAYLVKVKFRVPVASVVDEIADSNVEPDDHDAKEVAADRAYTLNV